MQIEEKVMAVAKRYFEVRKQVRQKLKEIKILLEVAGFIVSEHGDMETPTVYSHKLHKDVVFYSEDGECDIAPYKNSKRQDEEIKNNKELNKLAEFLTQYEDYRDDIWCEQFIDETDPIVGKYISDSELEEVEFNVDIEHYYRLGISLWAERIEDITVYYLMTEQKIEENYWKKCKEGIQRNKKIEKVIEKIDTKAKKVKT